MAPPPPAAALYTHILVRTEQHGARTARLPTYTSPSPFGNTHACCGIPDCSRLTSSPDDEAGLALHIRPGLVVHPHSVHIHSEPCKCCGVWGKVGWTFAPAPGRPPGARAHPYGSPVRSACLAAAVPAKDCWPSRRCVWLLSCCMSFPGRRPVSRIAPHAPTPCFIRHRRSVLTSPRVQPGAGAQFQLHGAACGVGAVKVSHGPGW